MNYLTIEVWDATGNKKQVVEVPSDAAVNRLIAVLVEKMNLPRHSPDGQMMSYKFHHRASGRQLLDSETLTTAGVRDKDILRLQPEITAGADCQGIHSADPEHPPFARFRKSLGRRLLILMRSTVVDLEGQEAIS